MFQGTRKAHGFTEPDRAQESPAEGNTSSAGINPLWHALATRSISAAANGTRSKEPISPAGPPDPLARADGGGGPVADPSPHYVQMKPAVGAPNDRLEQETDRAAAGPQDRGLLAHELTHVVQQGTDVRRKRPDHTGPQVNTSSETEAQDTAAIAGGTPDIQATWYNFSIPFTDYGFDPSISGIETSAGVVKDAAVDADRGAERQPASSHAFRAKATGSHASQPQARLVVGSVDDPLEHEADAVAMRVQREATPGASHGGRVAPASSGLVERRSVETGDVAPEVEAGDGLSHRASGGGTAVSPEVRSAIASPDAGAPLSGSVRARIESHLNTDLSGVRVHSDTGAQRAAADLNAKAFTHENHVWLGSQQSAEDVSLMAHEATHVVQQAGGVQGMGVQLLRADSVGLPPVFVQRAPAKVVRDIRADGTDELQAWMLFRGEYLVIVLRPDAGTLARFDADPALLDKLGTSLTNALNPAGVPVPETRGFLIGPVVRTLVEEELPRWVDAPDSGLAGLARVLNERAAEFRKQAVRADLEAYLGVNPGTIDWPSVLPGIRTDFYTKGKDSLRGQSLRDRADFVLLVLETEVATAPAVVGGVVPPKLSDSVWDFAMSFNVAKGTSPAAFSEKYLGEYVKLIATLEFVPAGFDLARYKPSGADLAAGERHKVLDAWVAANAVEATTKVVLDDWTASGLDFRIYASKLDLDAKKSRILDKLTDAFLKAASGDQELNRALLRMADAQATYAILTRLVAAGRSAEKRNRELIAAIDAPDPDKHPELDDLAGDPRTIYEGEFYIAQAINNVLSHVQLGARVDFELVANSVAIAGKANISPHLGFLVFLLTIGAELAALLAMRDTQRAHAREDIAERVDLSWEAIKKIIDNRGKEAEKFLDGTWIPMLKKVAGEWVDANYKELKDAYDHFATWAPQSSGRYKLTAWFIEDTANKLESGEIKSATLNGATVTADNVKELRTAVTVLREKAAQLDTPQGRHEKREEIKKAVDAYAKVKANIADGTYKPENYGEAVVVEAKKRLKIGLFEYTSLWQQATRQVVVRDNPFQAYTIAMWRVENIVDKAVSDLLTGFLRGGLLIGSLIVPGVGGLILATIDIGIGLHAAEKNIGESRRRLDLARLDTQLNIQGISVEDAEHALTMAWVSFVVELVLAGLFGTLLGKMALKGIQAGRMPLLTKLAETDAALAAKLVERIGEAKLTETLLGHYAGDGNKLFEALAYVKDGKSLTTLLGKVKDAEVLTSLLISTGSDAKLLELLDKFKNVNKLDTMLGIASRQQLLRLIALTKDEAMVAKLVEGMGPSRALTLMDAGLTAEHAIALDRLGEDAVRAFKNIAATGDAEAIAGAVELLRLNQKGTYASEVTVRALEETAAFSQKYAGRVSGDFVTKFARVAEQEAAVARIQGKIADLKAAGKNTAIAEKQLAGAQAELKRATAETKAAADILEGKTVFGEGRSVRAIPESKIKGVVTPEFSVTGGGKPDTLAEVKALGDEFGKIGKDAIRRNFKDAASQISGQSAATGQTGGLVRLDAVDGTIAKTNAQIAAEINGEWKAIIKQNPARGDDIGWVEVFDKGAAGESRRLLLKLDRSGATIDTPGTTRP